MTDNKSISSDIQIPTSRGLITFVDECDNDLSQYKWTCTSHGYAARYSKTNIVLDGYMHRIIYARIMGRPLERGELIDHIDCDGLNNRRSNLRLATELQNHFNTRIRSNNTSGFKGVHYCARVNSWRAEITANGKRHIIGYFKTPELAYAEYCKLALKLHGEFARLV